jgi:hypothetical protein
VAISNKKKINENGSVLIRKKNTKHDNLVNANLLVKYNHPLTNT